MVDIFGSLDTSKVFLISKILGNTQAAFPSFIGVYFDSHFSEGQFKFIRQTFRISRISKLHSNKKRTRKRKIWSKTH